MDATQYTKEDLIRESGLASRTIRGYIGRGLIPKPNGHGLAARYGDEHMVRAITIGRMRAQGHSLDVIAETISGWSTAKFKRYVRDTEPVEESPPEEAVPQELAEAAKPSAPEEETPPRNRMKGHEPVADLAFVGGATIQIVPLLPGLVLMLDANASPLVRRVAREICDQYRAS
jgi:DNA-binding transcriptional MerR regulator